MPNHIQLVGKDCSMPKLKREKSKYVLNAFVGATELILQFKEKSGLNTTPTYYKCVILMQVDYKR